MKKAMIFAAGLGTRLMPLTNNKPKALVCLRGKPLLRHVVERLVDEDFLNLTINVHHFASQIKDYLLSADFQEFVRAKGLTIQISDESEALLDTGGGLKKASPLLFAHDADPVLLHNVDIWSNARLSHLYCEIGCADALLLVSQRATSRYLLFDNAMRMVGWENIKTGEVRSPYSESVLRGCRRLAFSGIHVVNKSLVDAMADWPDKFGIMDFYIKSCGDLCIRGIEDSGLKLVDVGKVDVLNKLEAQETHCDADLSTDSARSFVSNPH